MTQPLPLRTNDVLPAPEAVLRSQGVKNDNEVTARVYTLVEKAIDIFYQLCEPVGVRAEITVNEFDDVFAGEGENAADTPLAGIYPRAQALALFALTMGTPVSARIEELFKSNDFALASLLDAVASLAADQAVEVWEASFLHALVEEGRTIPDTRVLAYSPGYCGWHISGQKQLFQYLRPERIGITLNKSCLMSPLKSVTGVLVAGPQEIHVFKPDYPFCRPCQTHSCAPRMNAL